jgi:hypothetical protein
MLVFDVRFSSLGVCTLGILLILLGPIACKSSDGPRVIVKGKLLNSGQPVTVDFAKLPPGDPGIRITFLPQEAGGYDQPAIYHPETSTFEVSGEKGNGIKPGKYKIAVNAGAFGSKDLFGGRFDREKTPIVRDIQGSGAIALDIDLAKPNG